MGDGREGVSFLFWIQWHWRYRRCFKKENRYFDRETQKYMYRYAAYCLNCRRPVLENGSLCKDCDRQDTHLTGVF